MSILAFFLCPNSRVAMPKQPLICLLLLFSGGVFAQTQSDSPRFEQYVGLIEKYHISTATANADSSVYYAEEALRFAQTTRNDLLIGRASFYKGRSLLNVTWRMANRKLGEEELYKAAETFKKLKNLEWYTLTIKELYILESHDFDGFSEKSGFYQALTIEGKMKQGFVYPDNLKQNEPVRALTRATNLRVIAACTKYIALLETRQDHKRLMYAHEVTGKYYGYLKDYAQAVKHFKRGFALTQRNRDDFFSIITLSGLVKVLLSDKQFVEAETAVNQALVLLEKTKIPDLKRLFLDYLYQALKGQGRWQEAFSQKEKSYALYDSLQNRAILKNGEATEQKIAAERKQMEAERLAESQQKRLNYALIGAFGLLITVFLLSWYNKNLRKNQRELEIKNAEISAALLRGQTQERKRVASDLHDNLLAKITGIRWRFQMIDKAAMTASNAKLYESVDQALAEALTDVRLISHNMLPTELEEKGLQAALQKLIAEINELGKTKFSLVLPENSARLSPKIEFEVYNIALELTTNILRHAQAEQASVELRRGRPRGENEELELWISDDGVGIDAEATKGMGIQNVRNRVENLGGTMSMANQKGTVIEIAIPIPA